MQRRIRLEPAAGKMIDSELVELRVDTPPIYRPLGYLVHTNRTLSNAARRMIEELEAAR
ncbi:hypothetical protein HSBAA_37310 [Vreelandella sulfidaeris]|uniref:LysR substrate-binding domain-containing protein n=1 Tax=Vreelandella sulfidaeris TaxID=115553 RepID=A0A455U8W9_9GAMM|nr:hypothetical protein HSBAA_37310 [Halomonas sulfidaeris]